MADFGPALTSVVPNNEMILAIAVCVLAPLALFRGPLELYGAGSAVISILMGMGVFNAWFLFALLVVPSMTCISSCVTQSWNMWAVEYNELEPKTFLKNGVPVYWLCTFPIMGLCLPAAVLETFRTPCRPAGLLPRPAGTPTSQCITQANATSKTPLAKDRT